MRGVICKAVMPAGGPSRPHRRLSMVPANEFPELLLELWGSGAEKDALAALSEAVLGQVGQPEGPSSAQGNPEAHHRLGREALIPRSHLLNQVWDNPQEQVYPLLLVQAAHESDERGIRARRQAHLCLDGSLACSLPLRASHQTGGLESEPEASSIGTRLYLPPKEKKVTCVCVCVCTRMCVLGGGRKGGSSTHDCEVGEAVLHGEVRVLARVPLVNVYPVDHTSQAPLRSPLLQHGLEAPAPRPRLDLLRVSLAHRHDPVGRHRCCLRGSNRGQRQVVS